MEIEILTSVKPGSFLETVIVIHLLLFIATFVTTTISGIHWISGIPETYSLYFDKDYILAGFPYSLSIVFVLGCHEFGHYFAAKYHRVDVTLPYFIPFPSLFGTMGAVIRTKSAIYDNKVMFDIGVYGPIAGFIASFLLLVYGFTQLPGREYLLNIHPNYEDIEYGKGIIALTFGDTLLFSFLRNILTEPQQFVPPMSEIYHYPYLCVGWFGLLITAMNMIPVGQLDGGHISYSMFGKKTHEKVGYTATVILVVLGFMGLISFFNKWSYNIGWAGWLVWSMLIFFVIKIKHPPVLVFHQLDRKRKILGYTSFIILIVSFSPNPFLFLPF